RPVPHRRGRFLLHPPSPHGRLGDDPLGHVTSVDAACLVGLSVTGHGPARTWLPAYVDTPFLAPPCGRTDLCTRALPVGPCVDLRLCARNRAESSRVVTR